MLHDFVPPASPPTRRSPTFEKEVSFADDLEKEVNEEKNSRNEKNGNANLAIISYTFFCPDPLKNEEGIGRRRSRRIRRKPDNDREIENDIIPGYSSPERKSRPRTRTPKRLKRMMQVSMVNCCLQGSCTGNSIAT